MRKVTQNIVGVLSLGVLATSWSLGQAAETGLSLSATPSNTDAAATESAAPTPTASDQPTTAASPAAPVENAGTAPTPTATKNSAASKSSTQSSTSSSTPTKTPAPAVTKQPATSSGSKTGDAVPYKYGVIQLEVVKSGSTITAVNLIQAGTRGPDWAVVPGILADAAVSANGSNFGNVSGATFTTQAFKTALESALAKF